MTTLDLESAHGLDDRELEQRARGGDRAAAGVLLERHRGDLVRFCHRYLGDVDSAEDAAQDVLAVLAGLPWPRGSTRAWLFRAGRNRCFNLCRQRRDGRIGVGTLFGGSWLPSPATGPRTALDRREQQEQLRRHLTLLAPAQAEVLTLRFFDDLNRKEIAEVLELTESVVKSRLFEGARELRRRMAEEER